MISYFRKPTFVFFGTPEFAAIILEKLIKEGYTPKAVICNPDKPVGRKKIITPPPVKQLLIEKFKDCKIEILQPENLNDIRSKLFTIGADLFIVAAYAQIISKKILEIPRLGTIGVHPSLLPKYRGSSPIQSAILNGEEKTGVTLYLMDEKMDHGSIIAQRELEFPIFNFQFLVLQQKLAELGANLLIETLPKFFNGGITPLPQDESQATYTRKFVTEDGRVELEDLRIAQNGLNSEKAITIYRKILALNPEPGVFTFINGKRVKLLEAKISDNKLIITKIQIEGKKPQPNSAML